MLRQIFSFAFVFAIVFAFIAIAEYQFASRQTHEAENERLSATIDDVSDNLFPNGRWDLSHYRQWPDPTPSSYLVIAGTGQLADLNGDPTDFIRSPVPVDREILPNGAHLITTDLGEKWLIQNKPVAGGNIIAGISAADLIGLSDAPGRLGRELNKYGLSMRTAAGVNPANVRNYVTGVMLVTDQGQIRSSGPGGVPLRVEKRIPDGFLDGLTHPYNVNGKQYSVLSRLITTDKPSARIIAFDEVSPDRQRIDDSLRFNLWLAGGAWFFALIGYGVFAFAHAVKEKRAASLREISTRQLIAQGENPNIEFKSTLRHTLDAGVPDRVAELSVLKTIAAFLNTEGGTLLIGVSDEGKVLGLAADGFKNPDRAMLHLTNLIGSRIGNAHNTYVKPRVEDMGGGLNVMRVDCEKSAGAVYMKTEGDRSAFYVRTGPRTIELPVSEIYGYIKTHFDG